MDAVRPILPSELSARVVRVLTGRLDRRMLEERFGAPCAREEWLDGIGTYDAWAARFSCGLEITITMWTDTDWVDVFAIEPDPEHARGHLGQPLREEWAGALYGPHPPPAFRVMRQDDHGGVFLVAETPFRRSADCLAARLEASAHKQMSWVEPIS